MKKATTIIIVIMAALLAGCKTSQNNQPLPERPDTWHLFCEKYGYDPDNAGEEAENQYLDCWLGSTEEEQALMSHGS